MTASETPRADAFERIEVRHIVPADVDGVVVAWHTTNRNTYTYVAIHQQHTLDGARRFFVDHVLAECEVWVAGVTSGRRESLCGVIALRDGWITQLAVFDGWQRRGIGSRLLDLAKSRVPRGLQLHTFQGNVPARAFYEQHGFLAVKFGISPAPENEPDVLYRWAPVGS